MVAKFLTAASAAVLAASLASAEELTSQANSWNLTEEQAVAFAAKVIDVRCELTGDCPQSCGGGSRQLGLLKPDGTLHLVGKNGQPQFNGATVDLQPYCAQAVEVDGLMTGHGGVKLFQVQLIRQAGAGEWDKADNWLEAWKAANPDVAEGEGPWFRRDPRVVSRIEANGYFGLGLEEDARFIAEW